METRQKKTGLFAYEYYGTVPVPHSMIAESSTWDELSATIQTSCQRGVIRALAVEPKLFEIPAQYHVEYLPVKRPKMGGENVRVLSFAVITLWCWQDCKVGDYVAFEDLEEAKDNDGILVLKKPRFIAIDDDYPDKLPFEIYKFRKRIHETPVTFQEFTLWELIEIKPIP